MTTTLLILHGLVAVALLGAITHQASSVFLRRVVGDRPFVVRYARINHERFPATIVVLFILTNVLGAVIYPAYRVDVRIPFEEMRLNWAVGMFEIKEHLGGLAVAMLPLYWHLWRPEFAEDHARDRKFLTLLLALIVWYDFLSGHVLNNIRGIA